MNILKHCNKPTELIKKTIDDKSYDYYYCTQCQTFFKKPAPKGLDHFMQEKA